MNQETIIENWVESNCIDCLYQIHKRDINITIFNRDIVNISCEIEELVHQGIALRVKGEKEMILETLHKELNQYLLLKNDIISLLNVFQNITTSKSYRFFLATVNTNMCSKFHTDINDLRMLCTYSGQGTLWLPNDNVNRKSLDACGDNEAIVIDEKEIKQAGTGSVLILKGAIYPKEGTKAIAHKSPTVEERGESRLLLRLDTNEFLNFEF